MGRLLRRTLFAMHSSCMRQIPCMKVIKQRLNRVYAGIFASAVKKFADEADLYPCIESELLKASCTDFGQLLMEIFSDWDVHQ